MLDRLVVDFGAVTLEARVAQGGFGEVYRATYQDGERPRRGATRALSFLTPSSL